MWAWRAIRNDRWFISILRERHEDVPKRTVGIGFYLGLRCGLHESVLLPVAFRPFKVAP